MDKLVLWNRRPWIFCWSRWGFIQDTFNLYGIRQLIPRYEDALEMILSSDIPDSDDLTNQK